MNFRVLCGGLALLLTCSPVLLVEAGADKFKQAQVKQTELVGSPLDRLDASTIDADERKSLPPLVALLRPHQRAVAHVAISRDGSLLASSGWDNAVHLFKLGGKEPVAWAKLDGSASGIAFSPDGKTLAAGCGDTRVLLWDVTGAQPKQKFALSGHKNRPFCVAYSPDGKMFASGCYDPVLRLWKFDEAEPEAWAVLANEKTPSLGIASLSFSHDGKYVLAGSHIGKDSLRLWDAGGNFLDEKPVPAVRARLVLCAPAEPIVAFAGQEAPIHLWSFREGQITKLRTLAGHPGQSVAPLVKALAFARDGKILASSGQDRWVKLWNVADGTPLRAWQLPDEAHALTFAPDGRHLVIGSRSGTLMILRLKKAPNQIK